MTHNRKQFGSSFFNGRITKRNFFGLATDAKPRYHVLYEDDDEEELYVEEILPLLQNPVTKQKLEKSLDDLEKLMSERKKPPRGAKRVFIFIC